MLMDSHTEEHFCTLFDSNFLPMGMALHQSLLAHAQPFHLWILCVDELVEKQLEIIDLPHVTLIPLREVETSDLLAVKASRSKNEYCWTLTPFIFQAVFDRQPNLKRATYLDADIFFFDDPQILLRELDESGKHVLITEHAYAPEYDQSLISGRFCVQFMTFRNTIEAIKVMRWWQERCLEWCFARVEDGKFGDQKYLDCWPNIFDEEVHIVRQTEKTLAPWNVRFFENQVGGGLKPVLYHFQTFRIVSPSQVRLYLGYQIGKQGLSLYESYIITLQKCLSMIKYFGIPTPYVSIPKEKWARLRFIKRAIAKTVKFRAIE